MIIAVNTSFLLRDNPPGVGDFLYETFSRITKNYPEHQFIFLIDNQTNQFFSERPNIKTVITGPVPVNALLRKWWVDVKLKGLLKEYKADVSVTSSIGIILTIPIPQCMLMTDLAFLHFTEAMKRSQMKFYEKNLPRFLLKAVSIVVPSNYLKNEIVKQYKSDANKIDVVHNGVNKEKFYPADDMVKHATREKYTQGREYFVCIGHTHPQYNLMGLLQAFSLFKKRQQTGMKLVLTGIQTNNSDDRSFVKKIKTYKYRDDVLLTGTDDEKELTDIIGSAYALVSPSFYESVGLPAVKALMCEVPIIASANTAMEEVSGDAALYSDTADPKDIADKMMLLYKDEALRKTLIEKGRERIKQFNWDKSADLLWKSILKAASNTK